ncbi:unnamed protein product, partial [Brassica rapa subsp. trilocularis]
LVLTKRALYSSHWASLKLTARRSRPTHFVRINKCSLHHHIRTINLLFVEFESYVLHCYAAPCSYNAEEVDIESLRTSQLQTRLLQSRQVVSR